jgi:hypothetical protein
MFELKLTEKEVDYILQVLSQQAIRDALPLLNKIMAQAQAQAQAQAPSNQAASPPPA